MDCRHSSTTMVDENVSGNNKNMKVHFDDTINEVHSLPKTPSSSSVSSSNSSPESTVTDKDNNPSQSEEDLSPKVSYHAQTPSILMDPTSQYSSAYAMGRPAGYDPNRIPASIFAKPTSPMDWSVASNESLFSIHLGNNSFSRDHNFLLYKSGELTKLDEVFSVPTPLPPLDESPSMPRASTCSTVELGGTEAWDNDKAIADEDIGNASSKTINLEDGLVPTSSVKTNEAELHTNEEDHDKDKVSSPAAHVRNPTVVSTHSDGSAHSTTSSFAFPVLAAHEPKVASTRVPTIKEEARMEQPKSSQPHSSQGPLKNSKASVTHWLSCFPCCSCRCSLPLK